MSKPYAPAPINSAIEIRLELFQRYRRLRDTLSTVLETVAEDLTGLDAIAEKVLTKGGDTGTLAAKVKVLEDRYTPFSANSDPEVPQSTSESHGSRLTGRSSGVASGSGSYIAIVQQYVRENPRKTEVRYGEIRDYFAERIPKGKRFSAAAARKSMLNQGFKFDGRSGTFKKK